MGCLETFLGILCLLAFVRANTQLLFANRRDVQLLSVPASNFTQASSVTVVEGLHDAAAVDFLFSDNLVFWTDVSLEAIKRMFYNGSEVVEDVITTGLVAPDGLACDWVSRKLYWTDADTNRIEVSEIDGSSRTVLFWKDLHLPRAIALDPEHGYMYWTDWGEVPKIERAGMDGMEREAIVTDDIYWPNGLTIDYESQRLYWVDAKESFIKSSDMNGLHQKVVLEGKGELQHPFALTVQNEWLYWTDWQTQSIHACNKTNGLERWVIHRDISPMDIHVLSEERQPTNFPNPCEEDNGGCSHLCLLSPSERGYSCACPTGVKLLEDGFNCANGAQEMLLLARRKDIRRISLDTPDYTDIILPLEDIEHAIAIDYDPVDGYIYWTDDAIRAIRRSKLDGSESEYVITNDILHPDGIAVDWIARNLYWTDTGNDRIEVARLNGTSRKMLHAEYMDEPRAITVDPINGYMYWTDWGIVSKIERANLDGSNRTVLVNTSLSWPNGIAVDFTDQRIYWGDGMKDRIEMMNADGTNRRVLVSEDIPHIFGFSLLGDYIYWTDWQKRTIERVNKADGSGREIIIESLPELMGLKAISMEKQLGTNSCGNNNGGCSHLCLYRPHGQICACPMGHELLADGKTCIVPEAFLLFLRTEDIRRISLETTYKDVEIPLSGIEEATALDFDILDNRIYWTDSKAKKVTRAFMNGTDLQDVIEFGLQQPEGLAVDWLAHNIYFADTGKRRIEVARLDGNSRRVIIWKDIVMPRSLALDPMEGYMYWCEWDGESHIERAYMDGSNREILYQGGRASGLTIDYEDRRLYWASYDTNAVESTNMIGEDHRHLVTDELPHPFGVTQFRDFVYWSDWESQTIERCNKTSGANRTRIQGGLDYVMDILVFHSSRQAGWNPCSEENGGCEQLCLSHPNASSDEWDYVCGCSTHYTLNSDNKTCSPPEKFLLFSQRNSISRITFDFKDSPDIILPIHGVRNIRRIAYDFDEKRVYWIDKSSNDIKRSYDNGIEQRTFIANPGGGAPFEPTDMAIDPYSRLLFWTCANQSTINVTRLNGSAVGVVISDKLQKPRLLALMPEKGLMFWTNHRLLPKIERAALDGEDHMVIVTEGLGRPRTLTADHRSERIYWISQELDYVISTTITGKDVLRLTVELASPVGLTILDNHLYWVDRKAEAVKQADKLDGKNQYKVKGQMVSLTDVLAVDGNLIEDHPCLIDNGGCSHLCIISPDGSARCSCPLNLVLDVDDETCVEPPTCAPDAFSCVSGNIACIPIGWRCDGFSECEDASDEMECVECDAGEFKCSGIQCIDRSLRCDGKPDCLYGNSDEEQCPQCSNPQSFPCLNGQCVVKQGAECDGIIDCVDGSDEHTGCYLSPSDIPPGYTPHGGRRMNTALVGTLVAAFSLAIMVIGTFFLCRRRCIQQSGSPEDYGTPADQNFSTVLMLNQLGKEHITHKYLNSGRPHPKTTNLHSCSSKVSPKSGSGGESSTGFYERNLPTGASSCSSEMFSSTGTSNYPKETLNPPPSPATERSQCTTEIYYAPVQNPSLSNFRPYRHHKLRYIPPPPTPCSTDICEDSEPYSMGGAAAAPPVPHHKYTNISKSRRKKGKYSHSNIANPEAVNYDSEPYPPPPTPHSQYLSDNFDSCPPSPSTERSFFNPYPPPPSPATDST
uniref:Low density lipoprotein receptor-related protein 6 n=1 Tax=Hemicentrotus pulcherrimus TaxID=7650 RepID=A0A1L7NTK9_HEMPU|nr:low density lipoprotein receptor-related protein 6 [Hemicentrotus pulcherrimus]